MKSFDDEFSQFAEPVARALMGEPNLSLSKPTELRFRNRGSMAVDLTKGAWHDHENGQGGGVLDLIVYQGEADTKAQAVKWLDAQGIRQANDNTPTVRPHIVATYDYTDGDGVVLFQVCRFEPKTFKQRKPDASARGGWSWTVKGVQQVPYRLPQMLAAPDALVFVVEGEKDADNLAAIGLTATCNAGGAGKWPDALAQHFAGRRVVVVPDNDDAGREHARMVASKLRGVAADVRVLELPGLPAKGDVSDWLAAGGGADGLVNIVNALPVANDSAEPERPTIEVRNGERARIVSELAAALASAAPYYRRDSMLVRAITLPADEEISGVFRSRGSVLLRPAKAQAVIADASRAVNVTKFDGRAKKMVTCDLPGDVAQSFVELGVEQHSLPSIVGVVRCPVMREDGTLQASSGYDIQTQLILAGDEDWSALSVPARPTKDDGRAALQWLLSTAYADFPYADDASKAVAVSSLLTAIIRPAIGCAPVHAFSAPQFGAGKSLQASFAAIVATGQKPAMLSPGHDQSEFEKRVDAAIIQADPVVIVDNVSRALTGDNLCAALTSDRATVRPLGSSIPLQVRTSAFWMATGQNLSVKKDMHRRTVISYVDARMERPETRSGFAIADLPSWAAENRMRILSAVYTMLRAHAQAGFPSEGEKLLGNFETWSRRVAHCLVWLGMVNPVRSQERLREDDPEITNRASLFLELARWQDEWEMRSSQRAWTLSELTGAITSVMNPQRELAAAVAVGIFNGATGLAYWLRSHKNVIVETTTSDGADVAYRLETAGTARGGVVRWEVKRMAPAKSGGDGEHGGHISPIA
jgi:hypothetical protein